MSLDEGLRGLPDCEDHRQTDNKRPIITKEKPSILRDPCSGHYSNGVSVLLE